MSDLKKKLQRMRRVHGLETSQLNVLVGDLARIDAKLAEQTSQLNELNSIKEQGLSASGDFSVEFLTQTGIWIEGVNRLIQLAWNAISNTESERKEARSRVMTQRTRVRGLEILIDQLRFEFNADAATQQMLLADENALNGYSRN